jgi:hypothetical protein
MKRVIMMMMVIFSLLLSNLTAEAQCSICTRTASQLGQKPARALNAGILYLAAAPLLIAGFIGYKWIKNNGGNN